MRLWEDRIKKPKRLLELYLKNGSHVLGALSIFIMIKERTSCQSCSGELCRILGIQRKSTTLLHPEKDAMTGRTNRTLELGISKYVREHQHDRKNYLHLVMMAYRSSVHSVAKYIPAYAIFGTPLKLPVVCLYETRHTVIPSS